MAMCVGRRLRALTPVTSGPGREGKAVRLAIRLLTEPMALALGSGSEDGEGGRCSVGAAVVVGGGCTSAMTTTQQGLLTFCGKEQEISQLTNKQTPPQNNQTNQRTVELIMGATIIVP